MPGKRISQEFLGRNVSINSQQEANEILLDFDALVAGEAYSDLFCNPTLQPFLSFWSDWDGSNGLLARDTPDCIGGDGKCAANGVHPEYADGRLTLELKLIPNYWKN